LIPGSFCSEKISLVIFNQSSQSSSDIRSLHSQSFASSALVIVSVLIGTTFSLAVFPQAMLKIFHDYIVKSDFMIYEVKLLFSAASHMIRTISANETVGFHPRISSAFDESPQSWTGSFGRTNFVLIRIYFW
jgi:hypothetical protein